MFFHRERGLRACLPGTLIFWPQVEPPTYPARPKGRKGDESTGDDPMNNSSFFTADRATHLKIVVVSLLASITVMVVGIAARPPQAGVGEIQQANVYKPPKAVLATSDT